MIQTFPYSNPTPTRKVLENYPPPPPLPRPHPQALYHYLDGALTLSCHFHELTLPQEVIERINTLTLRVKELIQRGMAVVD